MTEQTQTFSEGDSVVLEQTHHAHNSELKKNKGREGVVQAEPSGYNDKYLVAFEGSSLDPQNRFWVAPKWLRPADDDESEGQTYVTDPDSIPAEKTDDDVFGGGTEL